jgi:mannosyltransferase
VNKLNWHQNRSQGTIAAVIAIMIVGAILRFYDLGSQCLWLDEVVSAQLAERTRVEGPLLIARNDNVAPLSHCGIALTASLAGLSEWSVRLPSALASLATLPLLFLLGRRLFGSVEIGLIAMTLGAISPFAVWYAQDGRMYAQLMLWSCLIVLFYWEGAHRERARWWAWLCLILVTTLGIYTHQYAVLVSAACGLDALLRIGPRDRRFWLWMACQIAAALAFTPWLLMSLERASTGAGIPKSRILLWVPYTFYAYLVGFSLGPSVRELQRGFSASLLRPHLPWIVPLILAAIWLGFRGARNALGSASRSGGILCMIWLVVPIVLALMTAQFTAISYNVRYVSGAFPAFVLLLAYGLRGGMRSVPTLAAGLVLIGVMSASLIHWYWDPTYHKEEVRPAVALLACEVRPEDTVIVSSVTGMSALQYYGWSPPRRIYPIGFHFAGDATMTTAQMIATLEQAPAQPGHRIWLIEYRPWESDLEGRLGQWLDMHASTLLTRSWPGVKVVCYTNESPTRPCLNDLPSHS